VAVAPLNIIDKRGLYRLTIRSRKPVARPFQDWVVRVVLPAIEKNGGYVLGQERVVTGELTLDDYLDRVKQRAENTVADLKAQLARVEGERDAALAKVRELESTALLADTTPAPTDPFIASFARTLSGVNLAKVKADLGRLGYLYKPGHSSHWRVYRQYEGALFRSVSRGVAGLPSINTPYSPSGRPAV
jgi:hypothetical protein